MKKNVTLFHFSSINEDPTFTEDKYYELLHTGKNTDQRYGDFEFTQQQLQEMADNFNGGVRGVEVAVDINHDPDKKAYAWIKPGSMTVMPSKNLIGQYSLFAQLYRFTEEGEKLVRQGAYRYFSLEIKPKYEAFVDGAKKLLNNVIIGLALTNSPVIKELAPTYAEQHTNNNPDTMEMFNTLLDFFDSKESITGGDVAILTAMLNTLPQETQTQMQARVDAIKAKANDGTDSSVEEDLSDQGKAKQLPPTKNSEETETPANEESQPEKPTEEGTKVEEEKPAGDAAKLSESQRLSEVERELSELKEQNSKLLAEKQEVILSEKTQSFVLSEKNPKGFAATDAEEVKSFIRGLSEEKVAQFSTLLGKVKSVDFAVHGVQGSNNPVSLSDQDTEAMATKMAKEKGMQYSEALEQVLKDTNQWASPNPKPRTN